MINEPGSNQIRPKDTENHFDLFISGRNGIQKDAGQDGSRNPFHWALGKEAREPESDVANQESWKLGSQKKGQAGIKEALERTESEGFLGVLLRIVEERNRIDEARQKGPEGP